MKKNNNRKTKKLLSIVAMVLMVGLIAGMGAMTYAKYVTTGSVPTQSATAAKWGFVITADTSNLFGTDYDQTDATNKIATKVTTDGVAVNASGDTNVVAPGTTGSMTITVSGSAEVLAKLTVTVDTGTADIALGDYKPVKWSITGTSEDNTVTDGTLEAVLNALKTDADTTSIAAGETVSKSYTISWKWAFDGDNAKDTVIGYKAMGKTYDDIKSLTVGDGTVVSTIVANADAYNAITTTVSFGLSVAVEQIQK